MFINKDNDYSNENTKISVTVKRRNEACTRNAAHIGAAPVSAAKSPYNTKF
jgi:hypothetical protein